MTEPGRGSCPQHLWGSSLAGVTANPRQRILAALVDTGLMAGWALLVWTVLAVLAFTGNPLRFGPFGYSLFSMLLVVLPVTITLTVLEAGRYQATPGKHRVGLRLRRDPSGDRVGWGRCLVRSLLKLGLPWALAQFAILALVTAPGLEAAIGVLFAIAVPAAYLTSLFVRNGHTLYDWLTGTKVITIAPGRRFAAPEPPAADQGEVVPPSV
jgi:uncharacterized RDD family membrane protein YckC